MDQKNLLLAIVLSIAIMLGWQFYLSETTPPLERSGPGKSSLKAPSNAGVPKVPSAANSESAPSAPKLSAPSQPLDLTNFVEKKILGATPRVKILSSRSALKFGFKSVNDISFNSPLTSIFLS